MKYTLILNFPFKTLVHVVEILNKVKKVSSQLLHKNGCEAMPEEIADVLDIFEQKVKEVLRVSQDLVF